MISFVLKNRSYLVILLAILILARSAYKLFHGTVNLSNPDPDGFNKDYTQSVWIGKIVFIVIGLVVLIWGIRLLRRR